MKLKVCGNLKRALCGMATKVGYYFEKLELSLGELLQSGPVFRGISSENSGYKKLPMGQNYVSYWQECGRFSGAWWCIGGHRQSIICVDFCNVPTQKSIFSGQCFQCSRLRHCVASRMTTIDMQRHFGRRKQDAVMLFIDDSRQIWRRWWSHSWPVREV